MASRRSPLDAVVVGAGPNGLAAAITLARAGLRVQLLEGAPTVGGGCRSAELTLPGLVHDVCSAVYPLGRGSPFFTQLPLKRHGVQWIEPEIPLAHPLERGAAMVFRDISRTAEGLGPDAGAYQRLVGPVVGDWPVILDQLAGPPRIPRDPGTLWTAARFGLQGLRSVTSLAGRFRGEPARALLAGCGAHSMLGLGEPLTGAFGLILLAAAHAVGWPLVAGGAQRLSDALAAHLVELGGEIVTGRRVGSLEELPPHRAVLLDLSPRQLLELGSKRLAGAPGGERYLRRLRGFRPGPGVFKLDLALDGPIPWQDPAVLRAGTVHLGGTLEEIVAAEDAVAGGRIPEWPFVLLAQPSLFDPARAPAGRQTVWAYCHVPNGSPVDMTEPILRQIQRFAPGMRDRILALAARGPADLERDNPNYLGGDIGGGRNDWRQFFARPAWRWDPYATPDPGVFLCSASTPPGGGVHGLCGWHAARSALRGTLA